MYNLSFIRFQYALWMIVNAFAHTNRMKQQAVE